MPTLEARVRQLEKLLRIDRRGRTTWVWVIPLISGVIVGLVFGVMPGFPIAADWTVRLLFAGFGFVTTIAVSIICMISFDYDHNAQAEDHSTRGPR